MLLPYSYVGANERVHIFVGLEPRNIENIWTVNPVCLLHPLLCDFLLDRVEFFRPAVVMQERVDALRVRPVCLYYFLFPELRYADYCIDAVAEMFEREIKHPSREREFTGRSDIPACMCSHDDVSSGSEPKEREHARFEPVEYVELLVAVFPEKKQHAKEARGDRQLEVGHDYLPRLFVERIITGVEVDQCHVEGRIMHQPLDEPVC